METNEELRAKYNPEGSDLRRAQLRMLDMLLYLDKVCKENEITYWLGDLFRGCSSWRVYSLG